LFKGRDGIRRKTKTKTNETKPMLQEAFQQRGTTHNHQQSSADHHKGNPRWRNQAAIVSTTLLEVLIFLGDKETREYDGRKHIGAADLLREMARRKAANPAWNDEAAIGHCVRSFRNHVAVW
jgi:hypothetical protein